MLQNSRTTTDQRRGAVEARRAHNPDVPGSKPGGAIFFIYKLYYPVESKYLGYKQRRVGPNAVGYCGVLMKLRNITRFIHTRNRLFKEVN